MGQEHGLMLLMVPALITVCQAAAVADDPGTAPLSDLVARLTGAGEFPAVSLHLLPCGNVSDQLVTDLLRHLPCPRGCTVTYHCRLCHEKLIFSLYQPPGGAVLLWARSPECLLVPGELIPPHWAGAAGLLLPPEEMTCSNALSLPLFAKVPFPLCAKRSNGVWRVWRRLTFTLDEFDVTEIVRFEAGNFTVISPGLTQTEDLRGATLRVRFLNNYPYVYCTNLSANGTCLSPLSRPETNILSALGARLNFSAELRQHPRRVWGSRDVNGTWSGLLSSVVLGEADMAVGGMSMTARRAGAVQFLSEFTIVRSMFVSRKPPPLPSYLTVLAPLTPSLWALVVSTLLLVGATSAMQRRCRFGLAMMDAYRVILAQSLDRKFLTVADRFLTGVWILTAFTIACSYTSALTSFLINGAPGHPVKTLEQLAASPYQLAVSPHNKVFLEWLEDRQGANFAALRKKLVFESRLASSLSSPTTSHERAHIFEDSFFEYVLSWMILKRNGSVWLEDFVPSRDHFMPTSLAMPVQKNAPYRRHMDHIILQLSAAGIVQKWLADALYGKRRQAIRANVETCRTNTANCRGEEHAQKISLQHLEGPCLVLMTGYALATAAFLTELQIARWKGRMRLAAFGRLLAV